MFCPQTLTMDIANFHEKVNNLKRLQDLPNPNAAQILRIKSDREQAREMMKNIKANMEARAHTDPE